MLFSTQPQFEVIGFMRQLPNRNQKYCDRMYSIACNFIFFPARWRIFFFLNSVAQGREVMH